MSQSAGAALASEDPTGSATKRKAFRSDAFRRWEAVRGDVRPLIESDPRIRPDSDVSPAISYAHLRHELESIIDRHVLEPMAPQSVLSGRHWTGMHIREAWEHGIALADAYLRQLGYDGGDVDPRMRARQDPHREGLQREYIRAYADLEDIAADARKEASRAYDEGVRAGRTKRDLISTTDGRDDGVNNRLDKVGETRTEQLAEVYVVASINEAALLRYSQAGVEEVAGMIEVSEDEVRNSDTIRLQEEDEDEDDASPMFKAAVGALQSVSGGGEDQAVFTFTTAGDRRVCDDCRSLAQTYSVEEALNLPDLPPIHPRCRCFMQPSGFEPAINVPTVTDPRQ